VGQEENEALNRVWEMLYTESRARKLSLIARGSKELCRKVELVLQRSRRLADGWNKREVV